MAEDKSDQAFRDQGFVYWNVESSPDGTFQILQGYSGGEKSPTLIEPRIVRSDTREVVFDLWHTYQNHALTFADGMHATLTIENHHTRRRCVVKLDFARSCFAFESKPDVMYPLSEIRDRVSLH